MVDDEDGSRRVDVGVAGAQPALVAALAPVLRLVRAGCVLALLAVVTGLFALRAFPSFGGSTHGRGWAQAAVATSVVMLVLCMVQLVAWTRAMAQWRGDQEHDLVRLTRVSQVAHVLSYVVVVFGLWAFIAGSVRAGTTADAAALLAFALLFLVLAQVLAAVQFLRVGGLGGTIPAHVRRLSRAIERLR